MDLSGKTALITGSARRVGRALALALAERGATVAVHYGKSDADAKETVDTIHAMGSEAKAFSADISQPNEVTALTREVISCFGPFNVLVNSASIFERGSLYEATLEDWERHFAINVSAPFILAREMALSLPNASQGKIINIGDWRCVRPKRFCYGVSKAALSGLTSSLALSLAPHIQVNELALGAILPPRDAENEPMTAPGPAGRLGTLNEVASAMLALIENDFITGETIRIDGGDHIQ